MATFSIIPNKAPPPSVFCSNICLYPMCILPILNISIIEGIERRRDPLGLMIFSLMFSHHFLCKTKLSAWSAGFCLNVFSCKHV